MMPKDDIEAIRNGGRVPVPFEPDSAITEVGSRMRPLPIMRIPMLLRNLCQ